MNSRTALFLFLAAVGFHVWLGMANAVSDPVLVDEYGHLPAGLSYWQTGRFSLYRQDPPLVRLLAALPARLSGARMDYRRGGGDGSVWNVGLDFLEANGAEFPRFFTLGRMVILGLSALTGALIFMWAAEYEGPTAAVVCSWLWLIDPNVVAFSTVVTADVGSACVGLLATCWFWKSLRSGTRWRVLLSGIGLGMAIASKFSLLALYPAWFLIAFLFIKRRSVPETPRYLAMIGRLALIGVIALAVVNAIYLFDGTCTSLGSYRFKSRLLGSVATDDIRFASSGNQFDGTLAAAVPVPLPKDFVLGIDAEKWDEEVGLNRLSGGRLVRRGHWYEPLLYLMLKLPPGTILILVASAFAMVLLPHATTCSDGLIALPGVAITGLICTQTGLNWAVRYLLPALPFLYLASAYRIEMAWSRRTGKIAITLCLLWNVAEVLHVRPCYLSYANPIAGGPERADKLFLGSNYDWGQDLLRLRTWAGQHSPDAVAVACYGVLKPEKIGFRTRGLPLDFLKSDQRVLEADRRSYERGDFYWAISSNILNGLSTRFTLENGAELWGRIHSPLLDPKNAVARIGYSIFVFRVSSSSTGQPHPGPIRRDDLWHCLEQYEQQGLDTDATP